MQQNIREIEHNGLLWVNVARQTEKDLVQIQKRFGLLEQDIQESLPPFQRAKIVKRDNYYFMVLHFPVYNRNTMRLGFTEVDFFLSANYIVTVHDSRLPVLDQFFNECKKYPEHRQNYFSGTAVHTLFELLTRLLDSIFPILLHVNEDINTVDKKLFTKFTGRQMAEEILRLKTNIVTFRRTMQGHRTVLERLIMYSGRELDLMAYQNYINNLREFTNEIWHMLESQKESINALHETNESIVSLRTNEVMKTLTIISVITFPLTLIATVFAIDANGRPFVDMPYGFYLICGLMALGVIMMVGIFKKKDWL
ncbi:MAG: magnesium transporter CorA family protein [Candidatus Magasanikbacteria bacterium]|nr:magnesium transporter CorA family protein [Candidatus Magasanikbacteria bacterium]